MTALIAIATRDSPKRFQFFCTRERARSGREAYKSVGIRNILDYGNHSYADFWQWSQISGNAPIPRIFRASLS